MCQGWIKCPKVSIPGLKSLAVFNFLFIIFIKEKEVGGVFPDYHIIMSMEEKGENRWHFGEIPPFLTIGI